MLTWILTWLGNLLGGPFAKAAVQAYDDKLKAENSQQSVAAGLALKEMDVETRELELATQLKVAEIGKWYEPDHLFGYIMVTYFGKVIIWDKLLALGTTDPLKGDVATWAGMIMVFYFGKRGVENVARILGRTWTYGKSTTG